MTAFDTAATSAGPEDAGCSGTAWHIELQRLDKGWHAAIEGGGASRREVSLHELMRWLAELAAGLDRPSRGLR
jgi:hypothetical protein